MKFFKNILFIWITVFSALLFAQDASISLTILPSGQYTLSDWNNSNINLWYATIINHTNKPQNINVELKFSITDSGEPDIWGITQTYVVPPGGSQLLNNNNFSVDNMLEGLCGGVCYSQLDEFVSSIENTGSLPPGDYRIELVLWENLELYADYFDESYFVDAKFSKSLSLHSQNPLDQASDMIHNENVTFINLVDPPANNAIQDPNPWFRWDSPGFSSGISIVYRLRVYLFHPQFHSTYTDAIEDENFLYFDTGWDEDNNVYTEIGTSQQISLQYPPSSRELICGFKYIWYVEARDVSVSMDDGLWGWPEPVRSTLSMFSYGENITAESVISPLISSTIETVRPSFNVEPISCASSYEIWLSKAEDSEVENPIWESGDLLTNINTYPFDAIGLAPNGNYKWKIRINPDGEPSPWSEIFDFYIGGYSLDYPASGQVLGTLTPTFHFSGPADIAGYELRISDNEDPLVESGNIYNGSIPTLPFELPTDTQEGLLPGQTYFWKLIFLDGNYNIVGEIDDYSIVESFSVSEVEINSPSDGTSNLSLTPSFMWVGPMGVVQYEFSISTDADPSVESPFFTTYVSGTFFQYPQIAAPPLEYNTLYYWKIVPLDANENRGSSSGFLSFSTATDFNAATNSTTSTRPEFTLSNGPETAPRDIIVNLLAGVSGAQEYIIYFAEDQEMGSLLAERTLVENQTETSLNGAELEWGSAVYVQIYAITEGDYIGDESSIQIINLPEKPGSEDQVGINISVSEGSLLPVIEITNIVTNAVDYIIEVALDVDMYEILNSSPLFEGEPNIYSDAYEPLEFGFTYFFQAFAMDDDGLHGIPSSVISVFIPNVIPPELKEEFSWEETVPPSDSYTIQISTTEDFLSIVVDSPTDGTSYLLSEELEPGTVHYWRVQGYKANGALLGNVSEARLFTSSGEQEEIQLIEGGQIVVIQLPPSGEIESTKRPSFQWEAIEAADKYEIRVGSNEDYSELMWQSGNITQTSVQYPSAGAEELFPETVYYWSVRAISGDIALGEFCQSFTFTISQDNTPILLGPMDGLSETILPFFSWEKILGANSYGFVLASNEDCTQIIFENQNISEKQFQYPADSPPLEYDTPYYWKVVAYDENGVALGDYSAIATFNTPTGIIEIEFIYEEGGG